MVNCYSADSVRLRNWYSIGAQEMPTTMTKAMMDLSSSLDWWTWYKWVHSVARHQRMPTLTFKTSWKWAVPSTPEVPRWITFDFDCSIPLARQGEDVVLHQQSRLHSWEACSNAFLTKYFPVGKTNALRGKISGFQQLSDEAIPKAWERFQEYIAACPHNGMRNGWLFRVSSMAWTHQLRTILIQH